MRKYRNVDKGGSLFSAIKHQQMMDNQIVGILKLRDLIDWEVFRSTIEKLAGYADKDWSHGCPNLLSGGFNAPKLAYFKI